MKGMNRLKKVLDNSYIQDIPSFFTVATISKVKPLEAKNGNGDFKELYVLHQLDLLREPKKKKVTGTTTNGKIVEAYVEPEPFKVGDVVLILITTELGKQKAIVIDKIVQKK